MKEIRLFAMLIIALVAMTGCKDDDEPGPATPEQMEQLTGHWYAEIPLSGETSNWRSMEEGDLTTYDKIGALIYLNGHVTDVCYWGYIFLKDGDMVNYDGIFRRDEEAKFSIRMDMEGNITPSSHLPNAPQVTNMRYVKEKDIITADVTYKEKTVSLVFHRPTMDQEPILRQFWNMLAEEGIVGGGGDGDDSQYETGISGGNANEPSRSKEN